MALNIQHLSIMQAQRPLLSDLSLTILPGEILTLTGVSGSGKSTLLNWMIGHLPQGFSARGELWVNDMRCDALPTEARRIGMLVQDYLLFPHLSVGQNLAFALPARLVERTARQARVRAVLAEIGLADFHDRDPVTLSGGQRARVSLMRTLLAEPAAILLDEPFSKLDRALRVQFRDFVFEHIRQQNIPALLVTHDVDDAPPGGRLMALEHSGAQHV